MQIVYKMQNSGEKNALRTNSAFYKQLNVLHRVLITKRKMPNNFKIEKCRKNAYISAVYSTDI